jgi:hypothetical protein
MQGETRVNIRDVHAPPAKGPCIERKREPEKMPRIREMGKSCERYSSFHLSAPETAVGKTKVPILLEHGTPTISVEIEGMSRRLILDTSSNVSILQPGISRGDIRVTTMEPYGVTGDVLDIRGQQSVTFKLNGCEFEHSFLVCSLPTHATALVGTDFMDQLGAVIDFECSKMSLTGIGKMPRAHSVPLTGHRALPIFAESKVGCSHALRKQVALGEDRQITGDLCPKIKPQDAKTWLVRATENVTIAPQCQKLLLGKLEAEKEQSLPLLVCVEPTQIPIEGLLAARTLSRVSLQASELSRVTSGDSQAVTRAQSGRAVLMIANFSHEKLTIPKATVLGVAEGTTEALVDRINAGNGAKLSPSDDWRKQKRNEALYQKLLSGKLDHLSEEDRREIEPVLLKFTHVFHDEETNDFKGTDVVEHEIEVGNARPIKRPPYRVPYALRDEMKKQMTDMLDKGVIRKSKSPWSAPAILVKKKSLDGKPKFRFCMDFRAINLVTKVDSYPLPKIDETISNLHGSRYFTVLDLFSGFWQISIKEEHKEQTGFSVPGGHFEFSKMAF